MAIATDLSRLPPEYVSRLQHELYRSLEPYRNMMNHVLSIMTMQGFYIYPDGRIEELPIPKEWQDKIDFIRERTEEHINQFWNGI